MRQSGQTSKFLLVTIRYLQGFHWLKTRLEAKDSEPVHRKVGDLLAIATQLNCSLAQLAIAWTLRHSSPSTIVMSATSVSQLRENLQVFKASHMTAQR
ncbi:Voltage-gated potassium channel subunit beta-3 [Cichlidogyrus casuarinus]|uniref:Voltage-gated potassium channel subunit beta-3 n=1 Tax=Cichlidogyrus casuarinus TaxID=1844966 RepID=A0ABD2QLZ5_9PLAT